MKRLEFDLTDEGSGPAILLLPGSYATPAAWKGVRAALKRSYRLLSTSLPGHGSTPEIRPDKDCDIARLVEFVRQVVDAAGEPVHVAAHSWGAHIVLAALLSRQVELSSFISFEANPVFARPVVDPFPWRSRIDDMVSDFEAALAAGDPDAAAIIIDFYGGAGTFLGMPQSVRTFCRASAPSNLRDWHSAASFSPSFDAFSALDLPVTLVRGSETPAPIVDVTDQLAMTIPGAREAVVPGAGHFLLSTHPAECAAIIEAHVRSLDS